MKKNSCPKAEKMASKTINLPTDKNIKLDDAQKIVNFINNYVN
jgi:dTDP-4-amino-4,6-dideoxygalactose transaminase